VYAVSIAWDNFNDWSRLAIVRKFICTVALVTASLALVPTPILSQYGNPNSQTADEARLSDLERRASALELLPEREAMLEAGMRDIKQEVDGLSTRAWLILVAALAALMDRFLGAFGVRIKGGAN
jgi:hypothetical protein